MDYMFFQIRDPSLSWLMWSLLLFFCRWTPTFPFRVQFAQFFHGMFQSYLIVNFVYVNYFVMDSILWTKGSKKFTLINIHDYAVFLIKPRHRGFIWCTRGLNDAFDEQTNKSWNHKTLCTCKFIQVSLFMVIRR